MKTVLLIVSGRLEVTSLFYVTFLYGFCYVLLLLVITSIALLCSLVLIHKFIKQAKLDKNSEINYWMIVYHLLMNFLQFSNWLFILAQLVVVTKPN